MKRQVMNKWFLWFLSIVFSAVTPLWGWAMSPPMMSVNVTPTSPVIGLGAPTSEGLGISLLTEQSTRSTRRQGRTNVSNPDNEKTSTFRASLLTDYRFSRDVTVILSIPYVFTEATYTNTNQKTNSLGDIGVFGKYSLYKDRPVSPNHELLGILGVEFASGSTSAKDSTGMLLTATQQPGSGTTDFILGGAWILRRPDFFLYGDMSYKINGSSAYKFGNPFAFNAGLNYPIQKGFSLVGEINSQFITRDRSELQGPGVLSSGAVRDTGGETVYLSPGFQWRPTVALGIQLGVQLPVYQNLRGTQLASNVNTTFGVTYRFGVQEKDKMMEMEKEMKMEKGMMK